LLSGIRIAPFKCIIAHMDKRILDLIRMDFSTEKEKPARLSGKKEYEIVIYPGLFILAKL
jgi:hypothetical protein